MYETGRASHVVKTLQRCLKVHLANEAAHNAQMRQLRTLQMQIAGP